MEKKHRYVYEGPVMAFGRCIDNCWRDETMAVSPSKARSNMAFHYKKQTGQTARTKIELPGKIVKED